LLIPAVLIFYDALSAALDCGPAKTNRRCRRRVILLRRTAFERIGGLRIYSKRGDRPTAPSPEL